MSGLFARPPKFRLVSAAGASAHLGRLRGAGFPLRSSTGGVYRTALTRLRSAGHPPGRAPGPLARGVRFPREEGLYFTLKFLGHVPEEQELPICAALAKAATEAAPFPLSLGGLQAFPSARRPRVVYLGVAQVGPEMTRLAAAVERHRRTARLSHRGARFRAPCHAREGQGLQSRRSHRRADRRAERRRGRARGGPRRGADALGALAGRKPVPRALSRAAWLNHGARR
jgi:hypothetical protein